MPSIDQLVRRVSAEVQAAAARVHDLQTAAAKIFVVREQRLMDFRVVADRIDAILKPRLDAFLRVHVFNDIQQTVSTKRGPRGLGFHGRTTTLFVPYSDRCPARVELSFHVRHDEAIENAVIEYRLEILPIFVEFHNHDQLVIPIDPLPDQEIAAWIDDKLVEFTRTYFQVYFHSEYQRKNVEMDPVMNIAFPRVFAAGKREYEGRTYHFYTKESFDEFDKQPSRYVATE